MTPLFLYLLKVNIALALFYLAYHYGLRRLTFYTLNRFYLLFAIVFSSLYPLINLSAFASRQQVAGGEVIQYLPDLSGVAAGGLEVWKVLAFVFWSGVAVMTLRFLGQCISLAYLHFASRKQDQQGKETAQPAIRIIREKVNPFSFFGSIYINPLLHEPAERASIIRHESVHTRQWHTLDILAGELNRVFYWFNPGAWLMMTAIRENLEFIADRKVLKSGIDAKAYQYSLVKVSEIPHRTALANNFNFSHLKIRITMMDKKPSTELHLVKYLVLVPFVAALALSFNIASAGLISPAKDLSGPSDRSALRVDTIPEAAGQDKDEVPPPPPTVKEVPFTAGDTLPPPVVKEVPFSAAKSKPKQNSSGSMPKEKVVTGYPAPQGETAETGEKQTKASPDITMIRSERKEGEDEIKSVVREISFTPSTGGTQEEQPLVIIDGEPAATGLEGIDAADIASISVLKDDHATSLYGKKGKNGVILITSKANEAADINRPGAVSIKKKNDKGITIRGSDNLADALYIVDGEESSAEVVNQMSPDEIERINILKDKAATDKYGEKGESGVIEITTKE